MRSALAQQHRQVRERLLREERRALRVLEVARVAGAQTTTLRHAAHRRAKLQLLEADAHAEIMRGGGAGQGKGIVGSSLGQEAEGSGHLGNQV